MDLTISNSELILRIGLTVFFGILIGWEREKAKRPAGLRTYILVGLGSALFTLISMYGIPSPDPARIAAQIITGIGFLGAGTIFKYKDKVLGLTTAAGLWAIAGVGMGFGAGYYLPSAICGFIIFIFLRLGKGSRTREKLHHEIHELSEIPHKIVTKKPKKR